MSDERRNVLWGLVIVVASLGFSLGFACATPFAALGAVGALQLRLRDAVAAVLLAWLANQVIGFTILHYPWTANTFAWGAGIGLAGVAGTAAAAGTTSLPAAHWLRVGCAFMAAFAAYEGVLYATSFVLASEGNAFTVSIIARIFWANAVAFAGLTAAHSLAVRMGLLQAPDRRRAALA